MARDLHRDPAEDQDKDTQAAGGGPKPIGYPTYAEVALRLLDNGYQPLPLHVGQKSPIPTRWTTRPIDRAQIETWAREHPDAGVGLRTGRLVGIDIDVLDPDIAHQMGKIVEDRIGAALMRVGRWPKRLYLARTDRPFRKLSARKLEILSEGQQFVAFGRHPDTRQPYYWPSDDTPLDVPLLDLPLVDESICRDLLSELLALLPPIGEKQRHARGRKGEPSSEGPVRNADGLVIDGRDGWLSSISFHAFHDALDAGVPPDADALADAVWSRFVASTDLSRPRKDGRSGYSFEDAQRKVRDKLSLHATGHLPARASQVAKPVDVDPGLPVEEARELLAATIARFCAAAEGWIASDRTRAAPRIAVKATVGLGKSAVSRSHLLAQQARLRAAGLPHRILVFVPSLSLADEAATAWAKEGVRVAVHRGFEASMPALAIPMCQDLEMVRLAIASGLPVFPNACLRRGGASCHNFDSCAKQQNLRDVEAADIVVAAYDNLFTGLSTSPDRVALIVVDEGCWERAVRKTCISLAEITQLEAIDEPRLDDPEEESRAWAELSRLRARVVTALELNGPGPLSRTCIRTAGLTADDCIAAADLELRLRVDPGVRPGLPQAARRRANELSRDAHRSVRRETLFRALGSLLGEPEDVNGRSVLMPPDQITGLQQVQVTNLSRVEPDLAHLPLLHLDATLRPKLAATILPDLEIVEAIAAMPHMRLTAVQGGFGKATLIEDPKASPDENQRRRNRLRDCVDHVRWEAARVRPGRTLVVTYKQIEPAFARIPGVVTGHFKAIAGLDTYKDVALLIIIGRPLPTDGDLRQLTSAYLGHVPNGGYRVVRRGLLMRDGTRRTISVIEHEDPLAETMRAAVCDDEVIQAVGRGRGVNRTGHSPLEVQVLADVALPLPYDRVLAWDSVVPDIMQRMLLAGVAVDSPGDAAALHPDMFPSVEQAKKAFQRGVFQGQIPIDTSYREMSLKSALYRRIGRGRSWQRAWWISGGPGAARHWLELALGTLDGWQA